MIQELVFGFIKDYGKDVNISHTMKNIILMLQLFVFYCSPVKSLKCFIVIDSVYEEQKYERIERVR